jgi:alkanesulfonate monooxygenase SsuD/methylene tetrahydromethanopterin reductase-like flavin-dependent oxidoreductase (luciferase family)
VDVTLRVYPHAELDAPAIIDEMRAQAVLAVEHGFDGVMTSEHHGGFAGYLPNPLQCAGFLLDAMPRGSAAACPLLALLRPAALIAEETAWLAARFPGRVALGLAAGALGSDFAVMDLDMHDLADRFERTLAFVARALRGDVEGILAGDPAVAWCRAHPVPVISAAGSKTAARRAARLDTGIIIDSLSTLDRCRDLIDAYRGAGGSGPTVLVRRVWIGAGARAEFDRQVDVYRSYATTSAQATWGANEMIKGDDAKAVADRIVDALRTSGAGALNVRVHAPGIAPGAVREQIAHLGDDVLPLVRKAQVT